MLVNLKHTGLLFLFFAGCQIFGACFVQAEPVRCVQLIESTIQSLSNLTSEKYAPKSTEKELSDTRLNRFQTVFVVGRTESHIILRKSRDLPWFSRKLGVKDTETQYGDPRSLVLVAGSKIGQFLGFKLLEYNGFVELHVPQLHFFKFKLKSLNRKLVHAGYKPIIYNLKRTGLATNRQIVTLSQQKMGRSEFHFPFDDVSAELLIHEYSYHLIPMLISNHIIHRAGTISEVLLKFTEILQEFSGLKPLEDVLLKERASQLDISLGQISYTLLALRYRFPDLSFTDIALQLSQLSGSEDLASLQKILSILTQSSTTPVRAAILSAFMNSGVGELVVSRKENEYFWIANEKAMLLGYGVQIDPKYDGNLESAMARFIEKYSNEGDEFNPKKTIKEFSDPVDFLKSIDLRIQEIEKVI